MKMKIDSLEKLVEFHEGRRNKPYYDTKGILSIGIGRNLERGLTDDEINYLNERDLERVDVEISSFKWVYHLDYVRFSVMSDMLFNLGLPRFKTFKKMLAHLSKLSSDDDKNDKLWPLIADEMLDSKWAKLDVPVRAARLAEMMRTGKWPAV